MFENFWDTLRASLWGFVWSANLATLNPAHAGLVHTMRVFHMVGREIAEGQLTLRAMSLVYTTLLSLVPLLAVSFSVLKGFGVHDQLEPALLNVLAPLGDKAVEITNRIVEFVENVRVGLLGSVGLGLLLYTVISLVQKVERTFNYTWRVRRGRPISQRFSDYLSVLLVGPLLVFTALGLTATLASSSVAQELMAIEPLGWLARFGRAFVPIVLIIAAFTFAYMFLPNTRVRFRPALAGALVAGILWQLIGWAFATFVVSSTSTTTAIYSSFAILIIFMLWVYLAWLTLLIGASVAFYTQHPEYLGLLVGELNISNRMKERLALQSAFVIAQRHYYGLPPLPTVQLAERLGVPLDPVDEALGALASANIVVAAGEHADAFVPARDLALIGIDQLLSVVRGAGESTYLNQARLRTDPAVDELFSTLHTAREQALGGRTLRELVASYPPIGADSASDEKVSAPDVGNHSAVEDQP